MNVETYIQSLIDKKIIPGISLLAAKGGNILFNKQYGYKAIVPRTEPLQKDTLYDLASLTKPLVTALLTLYLIEQEKNITLDTKVDTILRQCPFDITLLQLLTHTSGLPAWYPFYLYNPDYLSQILNLKQESKPGRKVNYSCVGYILLLYIIEKISGAPFHKMAREIIFQPLGLKNTTLSLPEHLKSRAASTEQGAESERRMAEQEHKEASGRFQWRESVIQGETHDSNSFYFGGSAGNAGLFSTSADIFKIAREFFPSTATLLSPEALKTTRHNYTPFKRSHRTVGFKRNSSIITAGGKAFSRKAIGHNGFTGTSVMLEPEKEIAVVLLTNRIHLLSEGGKVNFNKICRKLYKLIKDQEIKEWQK